MKKVLKVSGIVLLCVAGAFLLIVLVFFGSIRYGRYSKKKAAIAYQREVCDTMRYVAEIIEVQPHGFSLAEAKQLRVYVIGGGQVKQMAGVKVSPEVLKGKEYVTLPTPGLLTTDSVVVAIGQYSFVLSGISYIAGYNYGMFGPVGPCFCGSTGITRINGRQASAGGMLWLRKEDGDKGFVLPGQRKDSAATTVL